MRISMATDDDRRHQYAAPNHLTMEGGPVHLRHSNVEHCATALTDVNGRKKFLCRKDCPYRQISKL